MAKTPKELEQIHEHNRKVLRELQFDSTKWLLVPRAIRALVPVFEPALQAAAELHKLMRSPSGAIPTATRWGRWRDGLQTSHIITRYPAPADWDAVSPESLIMDFREISEGDGNVVRCWDYIDLQYFNRWLSALAEQAAKNRATEKSTKPAQATVPEPAPKHGGDSPADHDGEGAAGNVDRGTEHSPLPRNMTLASEVALSIVKKRNPEGYDNVSIARLVSQVHNRKNWEEACKAMGLDPEKLEPPSRDTIARITGHRRD